MIQLISFSNIFRTNIIRSFPYLSAVMLENEFRDYLLGRKMAPDTVELSIHAVADFEAFLRKNHIELIDADLSSLTEYISWLIKEGLNSEARLVAIARYCYLVRKNDYYIHIAGLVNAIEVLPAIGIRLGELEGEEVRCKVFEGIEMPPLGSPQEVYPHLTRTIVQRMEKELSDDQCREVLTWNYHQIPLQAFSGQKERYKRAKNIDEFLKEEHMRFIEEITIFMKGGKIWFEQEITPEFVEYVKSDQELSIGRREGDRIYVTKVPFDPRRFLEATDPRMKRYYACHCPLARTCIRDGGPEVPSMFCHCSAGFTKLPFEAIFDQPVDIVMLESVLAGDMRCRFAITIPPSVMK